MPSASTPNGAPVEGVLYLHGFASASASPKARLVAAACRRLAALHDRPLPCLTPDLSHRPQLALRQAQTALETLPASTLIVGSSMGGFLATCLAERFDLRAALINPAVRPARFVGAYLGQTMTNAWTGEAFTIDDCHFEELTALQWSAIASPARYLLLLGSADETLDCRDALTAYAGSRTLIHPGGDHGFDVLPKYLPALFAHGGWSLPDDFVVE